MELITNFPLSNYCTLGIGGLARFGVEVISIAELYEAILFAQERQIPFFVLGKGSNCLFDDRGYCGLVILNKISFLHIQENRVHVGAGFSMPILSRRLAENNLSGYEFGCGLPATVGGGVFMNAGANTQTASDCLTRVHYMHANGAIETFEKQDLAFSYRYSSFQNMKGAIISAEYSFINASDVSQNQKEILSYRLKTQPYDQKSAGCIFRNPLKEVSAGQLIDQCDLKGLSVNDAKISEKHANFLLNTNSASAKDFMELIDTVKARVLQQTGIQLETEVRYVPYE